MRIPFTTIKILPVLALLMLLIPLAFIRVNNFHDWGDDFAQYLLQAKWMTGEIDSIPVSDISGYSPEVKGLLFSVLLIPVTLFHENEIMVGKIFVSITLVLCGLASYFMFKRKNSHAASIIITLFFVYNFNVLRLKDQLLPDFLFTAVLMYIVILLKSGNRHKIYCGLLLTALSLALKNSGVAMLGAVFITILFGNLHYVVAHKLRCGLILVSMSLFVLFAEALIAGAYSGSYWYISHTLTNLKPVTIFQNIIIYKNAFILFFEQELPWWINSFIKYFLFTGIVAGILINLRRGLRVEHYFIGFYLGVLLIYPYHNDPVRFLIPIIPFILLLVLDCFSFLEKQVSARLPRLSPFIIALILAAGAMITTRLEINKKYTYLPFTGDGAEMLQFVDVELPLTDTIAFNKPWALAYFTGRNCVPSSSAYKARYIVFDTSIINPSGFDAFQKSATVFKNAGYLILDSK